MTVKVYLFDLARYRPNLSGWVVNPHDHGYNFDTLVLAGECTNLTFAEQDGDGWWHRFRFASPMRGGDGFSQQGRSGLRMTGRGVYQAGDSYSLRHSEIHTIAVPPATPTTLLLFQYRDVPAKPSTVFFHDDAEPPSLAGLYEPMGTGEYLRLLDQIERLLP